MGILSTIPPVPSERLWNEWENLKRKTKKQPKTCSTTFVRSLIRTVGL